MKFSFTAALCGVLCFPQMAGATLINRGGGLIYDSALNITWQQNPNLAATNTFGLAAESFLGAHPNDGSGVSGFILKNGLMNWAGALLWIDAMNANGYSGFSDWRLPITAQPDLTCSQIDEYIGYPPQGSNDNCAGSEMGHLFYIDGITQALPGLFDSFPDYHWSGTEFAPDPLNGWGFLFGSGAQVGIAKSDFSAAWAVRSGDIATIPEPSTFALMALALAGVGYSQRRGQY